MLGLMGHQPIALSNTHLSTSPACELVRRAGPQRVVLHSSGRGPRAPHPLPPCEDTQERSGLTRTQTHWHLDLGFEPPDHKEQMFIAYTSPPAPNETPAMTPPSQAFLCESAQMHLVLSWAENRALPANGCRGALRSRGSSSKDAHHMGGAWPSPGRLAQLQCPPHLSVPAAPFLMSTGSSDSCGPCNLTLRVLFPVFRSTPPLMGHPES